MIRPSGEACSVLHQPWVLLRYRPGIANVQDIPQQVAQTHISPCDIVVLSRPVVSSVLSGSGDVHVLYLRSPVGRPGTLQRLSSRS